MRSGIGSMAAVAAMLVACGGEEGTAQPPGGGTTIRGVVHGNPAQAPAHPRVGLVYPAFGDEQVSYYGDTAAVGGGFPARFEIELDHRPDARASGSYWNEDGSEDARLALAFVMAFDDVDGDGTWKEDAEGGIAPDLLLGISLDTLLVYVERAPAKGGAGEAAFENPGAATPGYHLVRPVCGEEGGLGKMRILDDGAEVGIVIPEDDDGIEFPCLDFPWPTSEAPF